MKNENLALRTLGKIGTEFRGWEVTSVTVNAKVDKKTKATISLLANGITMAQSSAPTAQLVMTPVRRLNLGQALDNMALNVNGQIQIDSIQIELKYDTRRVVDIAVNRSVSHNEVLDLATFSDLNYRAGAAIDQIYLTASSPARGSILIAVSNTNLGQPKFMTGKIEEKTAMVDKELKIGSAPYATSLYTYGDVTIERVLIILK